MTAMFGPKAPSKCATISLVRLTIGETQILQTFGQGFDPAAMFTPRQ
jgi:hypothetical protein